ncbi:MAG TPA: TRAP transporter substrate-binding protein DctP, partial [Polyangia bacterium]
MKLRLFVVFLAFTTFASFATAAEPVVLRFATEAPDGTAWARLFRAMGRDIESGTNGAVTTKWYVGGIAGDELQTFERLKRGQLDVVMSGGVLCMKLAPSLRVLRLFGLFQSRDEASYVIGRLRPTVDREFTDAGFRNIGEALLGADMLFSRTPINSAADLKKARLWFWDLDETLRAQLAAVGSAAVGLPVEEAARAYEDKRIDGFVSVPAAALAFQWSAAASYLSEQKLGYLPGCM